MDNNLLKKVSRSFYLTLIILPEEIRRPISVAYFLARAADTIADTNSLSPHQRLDLLISFLEYVKTGSAASKLVEISGQIQSPEMKHLLSEIPKVYSIFESLSDADKEDVLKIIVTLSDGMKIDLKTFNSTNPHEVIAIKDCKSLEQYIYLVAGCVGEFWTSIISRHSPMPEQWNLKKMEDRGIHFGKALQLTNVLRDIPSDLRLGRCYLPEDDLINIGISPSDLLDHNLSHIARPIFNKWINRALDHYSIAGTYLVNIPRRNWRLRMGTMWPILFGLMTLEKLALNEGWLDPSNRVKISRFTIYKMISISIVLVVSNTLFNAWIHKLQRRVKSILV